MSNDLTIELSDEAADKVAGIMIEEFEKQNTTVLPIIGDNNYLLPSNVYTILKWVALLVLPALSLLVQTIGDIWQLSVMQPIALTIAAVATFVGAVIGVSAATNYRSK